MKYITKIVAHTLINGKLKCLILIVCQSLGMLIGAIFLCQANHAIYTYHNYKNYMDLDGLLLVEVRDINHISSKSIHFDFSKSIFSFDRIFEKIVLFDETYIADTSIYLTDYGFYQCFKSNYPLEGKWFLESNQCIVDEVLQKKYDIKIGDSITIGKDSYVVTGILNMPYYANTIILPKDSKNNTEINQRTFYIKYEGNLTEEDYSALNNYFQKNYKNFIINDKEMVLNYEIKKLQRGWGPTIVISIIALLYGVVNIKNIEKFYFYKRKMTYGIILAYGAMKKHVFSMIYIESSVLSFLLSIITYFFVYVLQFTKLNYVISMRVNITIFIILIIIGQLFSLLFALGGLKQLYRKRVSEIFRNVI